MLGAPFPSGYTSDVRRVFGGSLPPNDILSRARTAPGQIVSKLSWFLNIKIPQVTDWKRYPFFAIPGVEPPKPQDAIRLSCQFPIFEAYVAFQPGCAEIFMSNIVSPVRTWLAAGRGHPQLLLSTHNRF